MKEGLTRVSRWSFLVAAVTGSLAALCRWGFGIQATTVNGARSFTLTHAFILATGAALVVALYCLFHANENEEDLPKYN